MLLIEKYLVLCESGCKDGYIELGKGLCRRCSEINYGCNKCHYEDSYPIDYIGIKKPKRFQCDDCIDGYAISKEGKCEYCKDLVKNCIKCEKEEKNLYFKCTQCEDDYGFNEEGECIYCKLTKTIINRKCFECGDIKKGGVENCNFCRN